MSSSFDTTTTLYLGYDNAVTLVPYSDIVERTYYDMSNVTLVRVVADDVLSTTTGDGFTALSSDIPATVYFEQVGTTAEWRIHIKVGLFVGITAGTYNLRVIAVEPAHPNGLVLTDNTKVIVTDIP